MKIVLTLMTCGGVMFLHAGLFLWIMPIILTKKWEIHPICIGLIGIGGLLLAIPLGCK